MTRTPKTQEQKDAEKLAKEEAKAKKLAKPVNFAEVSADMVNGVKAKRAFDAVMGKGKGGTAEVILVQRLSADFPDKGELVREVYKALGGLLNVQKAKVNRANEEKDRKRKASK